jgi:hypothetical protein
VSLPPPSFSGGLARLVSPLFPLRVCLNARCSAAAVCVTPRACVRPCDWARACGRVDIYGAVRGRVPSLCEISYSDRQDSVVQWWRYGWLVGLCCVAFLLRCLSYGTGAVWVK